MDNLFDQAAHSLDDRKRQDLCRQAQQPLVRELTYFQIVESKVIGATRMRVAFRHLLPHAFAPVLVLLPFRIEAAIIAEASLSFLGFGDLAYPSWGGCCAMRSRFCGMPGGWCSVPGYCCYLRFFHLVCLATSSSGISIPDSVCTSR